MFMRTMYITADPAMVGPALDVIAKEAPGMFAEQDGYRGLGVFADRQLGKILIGTRWETEKALRDSDEKLRERRTKMLAPFASTVSVMTLEPVAGIETPSTTSGGFRLQRMMFEPNMADMVIQVFKETGMARLKELPGFAGCTLAMDRARGFGGVSVAFKDMASMEASRSPQSSIRHEAFSRLQGMQLISLEEFEIVDIETPTR